MLKKRIEFLRTYKAKPVIGKFFKIYFIANRQKMNRLGVTIPKAVASAVTRNKYKRWVKEVFKSVEKSKSKKQECYDIHVFIPPPKNKEEKISWQEFEEDLCPRLKKIIEK